MENWISKLSIVAGSLVLVLGQVQTLPGLSPKVQQYVALAGGVAGIIAGVLHPSPTQSGSSTSPAAGS